MPHISSSKLLANPVVHLIRTVCTVCVLALTCAPLLAAQPRVNADAASLKAFTDRVGAYLALQKQLKEGLPAVSPSDRTWAVETHQKTLATRIRDARGTAKPGDIFGDAAPLIRQVIARDAGNRSARDAYAAMQEVPPQQPPAVNAPYPERAALATVPPLILMNLPPLPDGIEYRFMGRDLIMRDRNANLIVDFISGAVPAIRK